MTSLLLKEKKLFFIFIFSFFMFCDNIRVIPPGFFPLFSSSFFLSFLAMLVLDLDLQLMMDVEGLARALYIVLCTPRSEWQDTILITLC